MGTAGIAGLHNESIDKETLQQLAGDDFSDEIYNAYKNQDGTFPKLKFIELSQQTDVFLTHNWGENEANHKRVARINAALQQQANIICWFDSDRMRGNIVSQMTSGIDKAQLVIVFITQDYIEKVRQNKNPNDNCKIEFEYAFRRKTRENMICVVMDADVPPQREWQGPVGACLGGELYIDFTNDDKFDTNMEALIAAIYQRITPYNDGVKELQPIKLANAKDEDHTNDAEEANGNNEIYHIYKRIVIFILILILTCTCSY